VQSQNPEDLSAGKLLVASRALADPNFAETVVLLVRCDAEGVVGLILNRRTNIPLSRVLEQFESAKDRSDPAYLGGPVETPAVFALLRSTAKLDGGGADSKRGLLDFYEDPLRKSHLGST
jgi:putative transcriptional regulator